MVIQESERLSLRTYRKLIKLQIGVNRVRGDKKGYDGLYPWGAYDSNIKNYEITFEKVLNGKKIKDLLKDKEKPIVVDLMAPTGTIHSLSEELSKKEMMGIAVSLEDLRTDTKRKRETGLNITQIAGDILLPSTWNKLKEQLQGRKADLIMERAVCGFDCIPQDLGIGAHLLNKAWKLLSRDNGIFLVEIPAWPKFSGPSPIAEIERVLKNQKDVIIDHNTFTMKLIKSANSPEKLFS